MDNDIKYKDRQYMNIVADILSNKDFNKMSEIIHHGMDRKGHSIRVSYYSYKISKILGVDYIAAARAGLLHDFFFEDNKSSNTKKKIETLINHPKYAKNNATKYFSLSEKEENIIETHMFPINIKIPTCIESWIVDLVDDVVAIYEVSYKTRNKLAYAVNFGLILLLANLR